MQLPLVMTIIARDRTGLVESVARIVADHGGNWLESRMCRLGGEFAGILRVEIPGDKQPALVRALENLQAQGLTIVIRPDQTPTQLSERQRTALEIVGHDRPGIVRDIARVLAQHGVNVEELTTECVSAPMSGESLFKAKADLTLPVPCDVGALRRDIEKIAADLMMDVNFEPVS